MRFSEYFKINKVQYELDFVDINLTSDYPLFIDPYAFSHSKDLWSISCHNDIVDFFQEVINNIRDGKSYKAKVLLSKLNEPNETRLGLSKGRPKGKGIGNKQALDIYDKLADSKAVRSGILNELSECELMIEGIGSDKISDITSNILRRHLIEYTQAQCFLHNIPVVQVPSGFLWNSTEKKWEQEYVELPAFKNAKIVLVPKASVRCKLALNHKEYYQHFVLNYLQEEHLNAMSSLVRTLKSGKKRVTKKDLGNKYPISKEFLFEFTKKNPQVLEAYKRSKELKEQSLNIIEVNEIGENIVAEGIVVRLGEIKPGSEDASEFHDLMVGVLEFIFFPELIYPVKEKEIHEGRKRIDIIYTNNAKQGFFYRIHSAHEIASNLVMVECKNYSSDPSNPELDQLSGRFSINRGKFGLLIGRGFKDKDLFIKRCKDTALDGRGFIIPLGDEDIITMLDMIKDNRRKAIDPFLENIFRDLIS